MPDRPSLRWGDRLFLSGSAFAVVGTIIGLVWRGRPAGSEEIFFFVLQCLLAISLASMGRERWRQIRRDMAAGTYPARTDER